LQLVVGVEQVFDLQLQNQMKRRRRKKRRRRRRMKK